MGVKERISHLRSLRLRSHSRFSRRKFASGERHRQLNGFRDVRRRECYIYSFSDYINTTLAMRINRSDARPRAATRQTYWRLERVVVLGAYNASR